ncbi:type IV secretion protein Rhs [Kosakonia radicincitans]|uniref:type VI secretion system Vgr family protein n=1 Tax=Kosakonia radicincitans TaxID=283686 RepID=UPI000903854C|nr:type VI secretion system tip protein TssI/VgrG [Kosakonia radicincitans]APG18477.1 type IV secretion protein Rhs [Kosakonia radicincitans]
MVNRISVRLPVEGLLFWKLSGREALSEPFTLALTVLGTDARIDRSKLLGQPVTVTVPTQTGTRYFNGKVTRVAVSATELSGTRYAVYQLTVEPDVWPMKRDRNLRIFQGQTVPQIVKTLLGEYQVSLEDRLTGSYRVWDYCVQYQESSFDFISRLMELEGIAYHFRHEADSHTLVLTDDASGFKPFPGYETIPYHQTPSGGSTDEEGISQWALEDSVTPGIYSLDDYDFRKPNAWLFQARQNPSSPQPGSIDVYDWPGRFVEHGHGEFYARIRQERWQVEHQQIQGTATAVGVAPGSTFTLYNAPFFSDNGDYLTTAATYFFEENRYASGSDGETEHRTDFTVIPSSVVYRPAAVTAWPRTYGPQTAKVVGPQGESIWTDKYGRVKVKFHWDRLAKGDDTSSCWVRVSSAWAGQGFGGVQIPRVGDEVVIDFINGDPDRPIITGRVYNEASMPPWALPAAATQMGFLSRSKDGSVDNANALRFEDKAGEEQVWIQAERNMDVQVKNDASRSIGSNHSHYVRKNELYRVEANQTQAVKGGMEILTGKGKLDAVVEQYILASGTQLRLVSGESAIELNANGKINLIGKSFNFFVEEDGHITTGGKLHLNAAGTKAPTTAPGSGHKGDIDAAVQAKFSPQGGVKRAAPVAAAPAYTQKSTAKYQAPPPLKGDYVYKNDPTSSQIMPFDENTLNQINKSPTLQAQLKELKQKDWAIQPGSAGGGSYASGENKLIVIDPEHMADANETVQTLAHEAGHAMYPVTPDLSSRENYINSQLMDEGGATLNNIKIQREILGNGGNDIGIAAGSDATEAVYNQTYDKMINGEISRNSAAQSIGKVIGKYETASGTNQNYNDYYGSYYDQ